ncbi:hypothetical protein CLAVI_000469 [Candidatus Clavichlamydia salmonicola]|uniref:hypothetical protein n=1 Tax=Candidatus Clavichlamydia salmonicola TaxID=469812 RepID=UPI0018917697|nr:hypothetical protein [Candidatus Clavichlamydia salmonicola]MBF5050849.1 hypothetical protein [Candidatus Clavichlamydia salmonicola]
MSLLPAPFIATYNRGLLQESLPELIIQHKQMKRITTVGGTVSILASFILLGSFIILFASVVCIIVMGATDIISLFVLPVFLPVGIVLLLSIPLIVVMVKKHKAKQILQNKIADTNLKLICNEQMSPSQPGKKDLSMFIRDQILFMDRNKFYKKEMIENIKGKLPKKAKRSEKDNFILESLDKASGYVLTPKEAQREDEREERYAEANRALTTEEVVEETTDSVESSSISSDDQVLPVDNLERIAVLHKEVIIHLEEQMED